jgi:hypothetical protein
LRRAPDWSPPSCGSEFKETIVSNGAFRMSR